MGQISPYLRKVEGGYAHWCPACNEMHAFAVERPLSNGARWSFDGNIDRPTFLPSMNMMLGPTDCPEDLAPLKFGAYGKARCHYFLTAGQIHFLIDCTHPMAGHVVSLPELPPELQDGQ